MDRVVQMLYCILTMVPADDPDQLEQQQQALEAAAAELHAAQSNTRYWTDYLQVWPCGMRSDSCSCTSTVGMGKS
jgi:hypothetical protein